VESFAGCDRPRFFLPIGDIVGLENDLLYMVDQFHYSHLAVVEMPWSRRKRLITEHYELQSLRNRKREEASRSSRGKR
jgi:hypothetical protein